MENTIRDPSSRNEALPATVPAAVEAPPPAADQPAGAPSVQIPLEVLMFLNRFFLAMQIPTAEFTEDQERIYRHSQAVLLETLTEAHRIERQLDRFGRNCVLLARAIEQRSQDLEAEEQRFAQLQRDSARDELVRVNQIQAILNRVGEERLGGRLRRAGLAVRNFFRRSHREAERGGTDEGAQSQ
ncbi:hypothetical protein MMC15_004497 [Xylographa vitiligo]|nr:hypothetical protein [Xylographa vitiligo]